MYLGLLKYANNEKKIFPCQLPFKKAFSGVGVLFPGDILSGEVLTKGRNSISQGRPFPVTPDTFRSTRKIEIMNSISNTYLTGG